MVQIGWTATAKKALWLGLILSTNACASGEQDLKKQLEDVNRKLVTAENDNARLEVRVANVEEQLQRLAARPRTPTQGSTRPPLKVIRLAPEQADEPSAGPVAEEGEPSHAPEDTRVVAAPPASEQEEPRPVIHIDGDEVLQAGGEETKRAPKPVQKHPWKKKRGGV